MLREEVLSLLKGAEGPLSGEAMRRGLGVSRAAVWKAVEELRQEGYVISSAPNRGYMLVSSPDLLSPGELSGVLAGRLIGRELLCLETVDSTNNEVKRRAEEGAPEGLVVLADRQTGGKGRLGRTFVSPPGQLYFTVLLRPSCPLRELMWLTAWAAVSVCDGIERACAFRPGIKWTNDIIVDGRKLCGILTELGIEGESGAVRYAAVGIGVNVNETAADFGPELSPVAISLAQIMGTPPRRAALAAAILSALDDNYRRFPGDKAAFLERYRAGCLTVGRQVRLVRGETEETGFAEGVDEDFALVVRLDDGSRKAVSSGEVSVRGMLGYAD